MRVPLIITVCSFYFAGCTSQDFYNHMQKDNARRCIEKPDSQYEQCMEEANKPYEQYQREREEHLSSPT